MSEKTTTKIIPWSLALGLVLQLLGCSDPPPERLECDPENPDCPSGYTCDGTECVPVSGDADDDVDADVEADADEEEPLPCSDHEDCDDGEFCNGLESCAPEAEGADSRGCVQGSSVCDDDEACVEEETRCIPEACLTPDWDGDGHRSIACGGDDCDDADINRYPGNIEVCDTNDHDEDCDPTTYGIRDSDDDSEPDDQCCNVEEGSGYRFCGTDCDDSRTAVNPRRLEICDGLDNDCDGTVDEGVLVTFYADADGDGYGSADVSSERVTACTPPDGFALSHDDCDDSNREIHPGAAEVCDRVENNCDGITDPDCACTDGERIDCGIDIGSCELGSQLCIDGRFAECVGGVTPNPEVCNGLDDDCNGLVDDGVLNTYYRDSDGDSFGVETDSVTACTPPEGYVINSTDCDDENSTVHPGATELCDRLDTDCSEGGGLQIREDRDNDGHAPEDTDICSGGPMPNDDCADQIFSGSSDVHGSQEDFFEEGYCTDLLMVYCPLNLHCILSELTCREGGIYAEWQISPAYFDYNCDGIEEPIGPSVYGTSCRNEGGECVGSGLWYPPDTECGSAISYRQCNEMGGHCTGGAISYSAVLSCR